MRAVSEGHGEQTLTPKYISLKLTDYIACRICILYKCERSELIVVNLTCFQTKSFVFHVKHGWREHTGRWHCCSACSGNKSDYEQCTYGSHLTGSTPTIWYFARQFTVILPNDYKLIISLRFQMISSAIIVPSFILKPHTGRAVENWRDIPNVMYLLGRRHSIRPNSTPDQYQNVVLTLTS